MCLFNKHSLENAFAQNWHFRGLFRFDFLLLLLFFPLQSNEPVPSFTCWIISSIRVLFFTNNFTISGFPPLRERRTHRNYQLVGILSFFEEKKRDIVVM